MFQEYFKCSGVFSGVPEYFQVGERLTQELTQPQCASLPAAECQSVVGSCAVRFSCEPTTDRSTQILSISMACQSGLGGEGCFWRGRRCFENTP